MPTNLRNADDRTRSRVGLAEAMKRRSEFFGEYREIALHEAGCNACRLRDAAGAISEARLQAWQHVCHQAGTVDLSRDVSHPDLPIVLDSKWDTGLT